MTIPTLIQNFQEKQTVSLLKVAYSTFNQSFQHAVAKNGTPDNWGFSDLAQETGEYTNYDLQANWDNSKIIFNILAQNLNILKSCNLDDKSCLNRSNELKGASKMYSGILTNGIAFYPFARSGSCRGVSGTTEALKNVCGDIMVDINGPNKGKNIEGIDIFRFHITKYGIIPKGTAADTSFRFASCLAAAPNFASGIGEYCTAWVLYNENMDYMHCKDLSWSGSHRCE